MWTCSLPDYWSGHSIGQPGPEVTFPLAVREQPQSTAGRESLAYSQLLSAEISWLEPEMATVCSPIFVSLCLFTFFFSNLLLPLTHFPSLPCSFHPLLSFSIPLSVVSWPDKSSFPHISLIPTLLASPDHQRALLVKDAAMLRVKVAHPASALFASDGQRPGGLWWWELNGRGLIFSLHNSA